jgi:hypothetical protein
LRRRYAWVNFGLNSPGPAAYLNRSGVGPQYSSRNEVGMLTVCP